MLVLWLVMNVCGECIRCGGSITRQDKTPTKVCVFDFLAMLGNLGIAPISPGSAFLMGATGPLAGARLLFFGNATNPASASILESKLRDFGKTTGLGMQVLEDSLCNWQKSPGTYQRFRG